MKEATSTLVLCLAVTLVHCYSEQITSSQVGASSGAPSRHSRNSWPSSSAPSSPSAASSLSSSSSASTHKKPDCRYGDGIWYTCDQASGLQKRVLKLRQGSSSNCDQYKTLTRPCRKGPCKYSKGNWSACTDGLRSRIDSVKGMADGCSPTRTVTRKCKVTCRYSRSDWGPCDGSFKVKKLTLLEGNPNACESSKSITKQCSLANSSNSPSLNAYGNSNSHDKTGGNLHSTSLSNQAASNRRGNSHSAPLTPHSSSVRRNGRVQKLS